MNDLFSEHSLPSYVSFGRGANRVFQNRNTISRTQSLSCIRVHEHETTNEHSSEISLSSCGA